MGASTGLNIAAAKQVAELMGPGHTIVTCLCDTGQVGESNRFFVLVKQFMKYFRDSGEFNLRIVWIKLGSLEMYKKIVWKYQYLKKTYRYKIISFKNCNAPICNNIIVKAFCQTNISLILNYWNSKLAQKGA